MSVRLHAFSPIMKSLRKSRNGNRDIHRLQISTPLPLPPLSKPHAASLPPQKVIRAIASSTPISPQQLPFHKGDFFYVTGDPDNDGPWYQAHNPVTGARGLVPKNMFEEFLKSPSSVSVFSSFSPPISQPPLLQQSPLLPDPRSSQHSTQPPRPPKDSKVTCILRRRPPRFPSRARRRARRESRRPHLCRRPVESRVVRRQTHR